MPDQSSTFHVPVLLAPILAAARGAWRAVDATLGDGGHAAALLEQGMEVLGIDRDPDALAVSRARLGDNESGTSRPRTPRPRRWRPYGSSGRTSFFSTWGFPPDNWTRRRGDLPSVLALRWTCGWAAPGSRRRTS